MVQIKEKPFGRTQMTLGLMQEQFLAMYGYITLGEWRSVTYLTTKRWTYVGDLKMAGNVHLYARRHALLRGNPYALWPQPGDAPSQLAPLAFRRQQVGRKNSGVWRYVSARRRSV